MAIGSVPTSGGMYQAGETRSYSGLGGYVSQTVVIEGENLLPKSIKVKKLDMTQEDVNRCKIKFFKDAKDGKLKVQFKEATNLRTQVWEIGSDVKSFEFKKVDNDELKLITMTIFYNNGTQLDINLFRNDKEPSPHHGPYGD